MIIVPKQSLQGVKFPFKWKFCLINGKEAVQFQKFQVGPAGKKTHKTKYIQMIAVIDHIIALV